MATERQKRAARNLLSENVRTTGEAMRLAGYSEVASKSPTILTNSKGWKELMDEYLPDSLLAEKHKELLTVPKINRKWMKGDIEYEEEALDTQAVKAGLDMAYKLKGSYAAEKKDLSGTIKIEGNKISFAEYGS